MYRFRAEKGYLLFPIKKIDKTDKDIFFESYNFHKDSHGGKIVKLGLKIPLDNGEFKVFTDAMKISEQKFLEEI